MVETGRGGRQRCGSGETLQDGKTAAGMLAQALSVVLPVALAVGRWDGWEEQVVETEGGAVRKWPRW